MTHFDPHTYEYDNHPCFAVGDRSCRDRVAALELVPVDPSEQIDGWVEADTLAGVAEQLGIDARGLEEQVREFNKHASRGVDPVFHRGEKPWEVHFLPDNGLPNRSLRPITDPPFVGHRVRPGVFGTRGGPVIDETARVISFDQQPIPGLYGAGNVVAHPFGPAYPGGGGTLGPAVTFGHVAGKSILVGNGGK